MDYKKHYEKLISRGKSRIYNKNEYIEKHHIIPKCMGGSDDISNLVNLYAREHFVAHQLLVKIYPEEKKLVYSLVKMSSGKGYHKGRINNRLYGWIKKRNNLLQSKSKKNKPWSVNRRKAYEENPPIQPESANISRSRKLKGRMPVSSGMLGKSQTKEMKERSSIAQAGKMKSTSRTIYAWLKSPQGEEILFGPLLHECKKYNLILEYTSGLCKGKYKSYKGWTFIRYATEDEKCGKISYLKEKGLML